MANTYRDDSRKLPYRSNRITVPVRSRVPSTSATASPTSPRPARATAATASQPTSITRSGTWRPYPWSRLAPTTAVSSTPTPDAAQPSAPHPQQNRSHRGKVTRDPATRRVRTGANCTCSLIVVRSEEHTSELQSRGHLVCRLLLEKKKRKE